MPTATAYGSARPHRLHFLKETFDPRPANLLQVMATLLIALSSLLPGRAAYAACSPPVNGTTADATQITNCYATLASPTFTGAVSVGDSSGGTLNIGGDGWIHTGTYFEKLGTDRFYITSSTPTSYLYSANTYLGGTSGDAIHLRGNSLDWNTGQLNANGSLYIGTTDDNPARDQTPGSYLSAASGYVSIRDDYALLVGRGSNGGLVDFFNGGISVGTISVATSSTAYNTTSDRRRKEHIVPTALGLDTLLKIPVEDFDFIGDPAKQRQQGFIAQELYKYYPEAVTTNGDDGAVPLKPTAQPWQVDYGRVTPLLAQSIKDLAAINRKQAAEIAELRSQVAGLQQAAALRSAEDEAQAKRLDILEQNLLALQQQQPQRAAANERMRTRTVRTVWR